MGISIKTVAQSAMDRYYGDYKPSVAYFDFQDFVVGCGMSWASICQKMYITQYAELRAERDDSMVSFDPLFLSEQEIVVDKKSMFAKFERPVMAFGFSEHSVGIQDVTVVDPVSDYGDVERLPQSSKWQINLFPSLNKVFYSPRKDGLDIIKKGSCNVNKIRVSYVPAVDMNGDYEIPEGVADDVIQQCLSLIVEGRVPVIKKANDQNPNMIVESEINKNSIR